MRNFEIPLEANSGGYLLPQVRASHGSVIRKNMYTHAMKHQHIRDTDLELAAEELSLRFLLLFSKSMALELRNMIFCESTSCHLMTSKILSKNLEITARMRVSFLCTYRNKDKLTGTGAEDDVEDEQYDRACMNAMEPFTSWLTKSAI
uniref:Uncharacterized protein n=1 Tax=Glossina austeni TaxID=7395 RepID=A0A1A9UMN2_GLOAU